MILETYQEEQSIVQQDPPGQSFATVGTVYEDGIALIFNGTEKEAESITNAMPVCVLRRDRESASLKIAAHMSLSTR